MIDYKCTDVAKACICVDEELAVYTMAYFIYNISYEKIEGKYETMPASKSTFYRRIRKIKKMLDIEIN